MENRGFGQSTVVEAVKGVDGRNFTMIRRHWWIALLWQQTGVVSLLRSGTPPKQVIVIGGGAAGYFSAVECARILREAGQQKYEVTVLEAGQVPLSKVLISGGGRCNVMHNPLKGAGEIAKGYPRGSKELLGPLNAKFGPWETFNWFTSRLPKGVELKTESDGRVFPSTDSSSTIADTLVGAAKKNNVNIRCGARVTDVHKLANQKFAVSFVSSSQAVFDSVKTSTNSNKKEDAGDDSGVGSKRDVSVLECDRLIFATGSSRGGYNLLRKLGHSLVDPLPSLFSFKIDDSTLRELAGVSVQHSEVRLVLPKDFNKGPHKHLVRPQSLPLLTQKGPLLITHQGLSGPAVLRLSAFSARVTAALAYKFDVEVCWLPDVSSEVLFEHLWKERERHPTRLIGKGFPSVPPSMLEDSEDESYTSYNEATDETDEKADTNRGALTRRLWGYILQRCGIPSDNRWEKASKADVNRLVTELLNGRYSVCGRGQYRDEFVTCGGVPLKEVSFETFESKMVPGLHLCGEVLDIDGVTGGYNFQSAWTGGWTAGNAVGNALAALPP